MESMGAGYYKIVDLNGNTLEVNESLLINPNFKEKFSDIFLNHTE